VLQHLASKGMSRSQFVLNCKQCIGKDGKLSVLFDGLCQDDEDE
jgi:hypothetical protein